MNIVILAAGKGTRMRSDLPKVLQPVGGKPMLGHVLDVAESLGADNKVFIVVGHRAELVKEKFAGRSAVFVEQSEQKGTGHAVMQALPFLDVSVPTLVLYGDVPLICRATLEKLVSRAKEGFALLTLRMQDPTGYGRIERRNGKVVGIVEQKDASDEQKLIKEVNTGFMVLPTDRLSAWLGGLSCSNSQGEYYLTDLVAAAVADGLSVQTLEAEDEWEVAGANDKIQLAGLERAYQRRQARALMTRGVTLADPERIDVRGTLSCGSDVFIDVGCVFEGDVVLGRNVSVGPYCVIRDTKIGDGVKVEAYSHFDQAQIGPAAKVGPFARLRPGAVLAGEVHIGNFVEFKKSEIGFASKVNHLSYIGDSSVGSRVNIGAGTITCNYDGVNKFRTVIEDDCFIGSDTQLVAPVVVKAGATVGAGSTITKDVPEKVLAISRARQTCIEGWKRPTKK
jgi:bifunctional UDP-N-acetylglucosamine pyrophosphorylase/glucosamine-1-phosphate N-acetyltransferase